MRFLLAVAVAASGLAAVPAHADYTVKAGAVGTRIGARGVAATCTAVAQPAPSFVSLTCISEMMEVVGTGPVAATAPVVGLRSTRVCWVAHAVYVQATDVIVTGCRDF